MEHQNEALTRTIYDMAYTLAIERWAASIGTGQRENDWQKLVAEIVKAYREWWGGHPSMIY